MKKVFILSFALIAFAIAGVKAQTNQYFAAMQKEINALEQMESQEEFLTAANIFERIGEAETKEWYPLYYAAYAKLLGGIMTRDKQRQDELYDQALLLLNKADQRSPRNSEIYALKGYVKFMMIAVDPMNRYQDGAAADKELATAELLNPENPRVFLIKGQNIFYTPKAYGGGREEATPMLLKAEKLFQADLKVDSLAPNWGKQRILFLLNQQ